MSKKEDITLEQLQNHLMSAPHRQAEECRVKNTDRTDVDMDDYVRAVEEPAEKKHRRWAVIFVLVMAAVAGYLVWRYL